MSHRSLNILSSNRGFSLIETLLVVTIVGILTAIAIPVMTSQRRLLRSASMMREVMAQMRFARQLAISQRQAVTFQYDDAASKKQISIINHHNNEVLKPGCKLSRTAIFAASGFPNTVCSTVVLTLPLAQGGLTAKEITYGIPSASQLPAGAPVIPVTKLDDNIVKTPLTNGKVNITFQPDGSVIDAAGIPLDRALYFFSSKAAQGTASALSVAGASGRIKVWRYSTYGNHYVE
jgi:prepilin-type N-terminal cleavage/methylation domain-containing protein